MRTTIIFCTLPLVACLAPAADPPPASATTEEPDPTTSTTADSTDTTSTSESGSESESESESASLGETTMPPPPNCGDGEKDSDEECDNGQDNANDAQCTKKCKNAFCGDGHIYVGMETCDGSGTETAECNANCTIAECGDGILNAAAGEECDDDNVYPNDDCTDICAISDCGDGIVQDNVETCDDGNEVDTDVCTAKCVPNTCGDGFQNIGVEGCDDNNTTDGDNCSSDCHAERWVFTTSVQFAGDMNPNIDNPDHLKGIELADERCNILAQAVKPPLPGKYKAWLSTDSASPATRFDTAFTGLYRLRAKPMDMMNPDYPVIATAWTGLTKGVLDEPINRNEKGETTDANVWTGTTTSGLNKAEDMTTLQNCEDWTDQTAQAMSGDSGNKDVNWTEETADLDCDNTLRLYCFQDI